MTGNWIWNPKASEKNVYVNFVRDFELDAPSSLAKLFISADTEYAVWINGEFVSCGMWHDYPKHRITYDTIDIYKYLKMGSNRMVIKAYYQGETSMQYSVGDAGLFYRIENATTFIESDEKTLTSIADEYQNGEMFKTTMQLGYGFCYDAKKDIDLFKELPKLSKAVVKKRITVYERPLKKLVLSDNYERKVIAQGLFKRDKGYSTIAEAMQHDFLSSRYFEEIFDGKNTLPGAITPKATDDFYLLIDLGEEIAGYLSFDIDASKSAKVDIAYGEHLKDLRVRSNVGGRNFANRCTLKEGRQTFTYYFRRIAGRYIQLHISDFSHLTIYDVKIINAEYPVKNAGKFTCCDSLHEKIYEVSKKTLHICMHEHYEDSPWREQGLYGSDSRNQILSGYYAFSEFDMVKESFNLISHSVRENGFIDVCAPSDIDLYLPSFTFTWFLSVRDYLEYSGDKEYVLSLWPTLSKMLEKYAENLYDNLAAAPVEEDACWNFYEWTEGNYFSQPFEKVDNIRREDGFLDGLYNAFLSLSYKAASQMAETLGKPEEAKRYKKLSDMLNEGINDNFFDEEKKIYSSYSFKGKKRHYGELMQAIAILCGAADEEKASYIRTVLIDEKNTLVKTMLSYMLYKYDALLMEKEKYLPSVMRDIEKRWGRMLFENSKTFWETELGCDDFDNAGSMCHGWTAVPIYIYFRYVLGITPEFMRGECDEVKISNYLPRVCGEVETLIGRKTVKNY